MFVDNLEFLVWSCLKFLWYAFHLTTEFLEDFSLICLGFIEKMDLAWPWKILAKWLDKTDYLKALCQNFLDCPFRVSTNPLENPWKINIFFLNLQTCQLLNHNCLIQVISILQYHLWMKPSPHLSAL
jgi:hypothetical protein